MKWDEVDEGLRRQAARVGGGMIYPLKDGFYGNRGTVVTEDQAWDELFQKRCQWQQVFRHKKGGIYVIMTIAVSTETGRDVVVYRHLAPHSSGVWVRDLEEFYDEGRFTRISA